MRITIPTFDTKKELFQHLVDNKKSLIAQKKSLPIWSEPVSFPVIKVDGEGKVGYGVSVKSNAPVTENVDVLRVKVVANTANWIDSHKDMILPGAANKSITERKGIIPFLHDHEHKLDAEIADVIDIYPQQMSLRELGLKMGGTTESIIFIGDVRREYNEKVFEKYKAGRIKQHSIGLQYISLDLAVNDEDWGKEKDFWDKYYPQVINKDVADQDGYFWVINEYRLIENSAVLFGSNVLTPTLDNNMKDIGPVATTQDKEPSVRDTRKLDALNKLLNKLQN